MARALLDANVLISAALCPSGPPGQVVAALLEHEAFELLVCPAIVAEVERALRRPKIRAHLLEPDAAPLWLADVLAVADIVSDAPDSPRACRDPDDDKVLEAAVRGRADVIVTGDNDLLVLKAHEGLPIMAPREFLGFLSRGR